MKYLITSFLLFATIVTFAKNPEAVLAGSNAVAFKSSADIAPGSRQRIATKGDWRDFGTERKFTRVLLNSPTAQNVSLEKFDWERNTWVEVWASDAVVSGQVTATFTPAASATKLRSRPAGVKLDGVFNDSPVKTKTKLAVTTTVGVPVTLPAKINVQQKNGGTLLLPVIWDADPTDRYQSAGHHTINGAYSADGISGKVQMKVTVTTERGLIETPTPYRGWNSWYSQFTGVSEASTKEQVLLMEQKGLTAVGFNIIWIDEGWWGINAGCYSDNRPNANRATAEHKWRGANGAAVPNDKFPDVKAFADWLHARGLKLGWYTDVGDGSCGRSWGAGGENWFAQYRADLKQFKEWGVDALKVDHCGGEGSPSNAPATPGTGHNDFNQMANFQTYAGFYQAMREPDPDRPGETLGGNIILNICEWGEEASGDWAYKIAHSWRTGSDLGAPALGRYYDYWNRNLNNGASRPGAFNDPDYLVLTDKSPSRDPEVWRTQISLWAFAAAPLITSMDAKQLTDKHIDYITNTDMLSIDSDPLVEQPVKIREDKDGLQVWSRRLVDSNGKARRAVMLLNAGSGADGKIVFDFSETGLKNVCRIRNVWDKLDEPLTQRYETTLQNDALVLLLVEGDATVPVSGFAELNHARYGKATASSSAFSGYRNASAFRSQGAIDGNTGTAWKAHNLIAGLDGSQWLSVELPEAKTVSLISVNTAAFEGASQVEYWNGSKWVVLPETVTASLPADETSWTLAKPVTAAIWRWRAPVGGQPQINEFRLHSNMPETAQTLYDLPTDVVTPSVVEGAPKAGKRVKATTAGWEQTNVYHTLYLPKSNAKKKPVIVEYAGNGGYRNGLDVSLGTVEDCQIGYALSSGKAIWLCLPYIEVRDGVKQNCLQWWGDVEETVNYCIATVNDVCKRYGGDPDKLIIAGFSRSSIGCSYIGLHNERIAPLWAGFFCHSHFDGVHKWGYPASDKASALGRLQRLANRPVWISSETDAQGVPLVEATRQFLHEAGVEGNFTFATLPYPNHTTHWLSCDLPIRAEARQWYNNLLLSNR